MARFKVSGSHAVDGVAPGGTVEIDDDARARSLVRAGHLTPNRKKRLVHIGETGPELIDPKGDAR